MLFLLAFWVYFMWRMKKTSGGWWGVQRRQTELLEQEIELFRQTNELLKKLVATR